MEQVQSKPKGVHHEAGVLFTTGCCRCWEVMSFHGCVHAKRGTDFTKCTEATPAQEISEHQVVGCQKNNLWKYVLPCSYTWSHPEHCQNQDMRLHSQYSLSHVLSSQELFHTPWKQYLLFPSVHTRQLLVFKYDQYHPNPWSLTSVSCQSLRLRFPNWPRTSNAISITHSLQGLWHQLHINPGNALVLLPQAPHQEPQIPQVRFGRWKEGVKAGRSDLGKEEYLK